MAESADLTRKYRPSTFDDVQGNTEAVNTLRKVADAVNAGTSPFKQTFLLTGPRGTGKTTLPRVFANEIGSSGGDLQEIDTANFNGVNTSREIARQMNFRPRGKARVYIIDECHELTHAGQEALLKSLEEPPEHVFFFLCTTNPERIAVTTKSRCCQLHTAELGEDMLARHLRRVARKEGVRIGEDVCQEIAEHTFGNPREALVLLGQVLAVSDGDKDEIKRMVRKEAEKREEGIKLCRQLMKGESWKNIAYTIKNCDEDPERLRQAVLGYSRTALLGGELKAYLIIDAFDQPIFYAPRPLLVKCAYEACCAVSSR